MIFSEAERLSKQIDDHVTLAAFWRLWTGGAIDDAPAVSLVPELVDWLNQDTLDKGWDDENTNRAARRGYSVEVLECWLDAKAVAAQELALSAHVSFESDKFVQAKTSENKYPKLLVEVLDLAGTRSGQLYLYAVDLQANTVESVSSTLAWTQQYGETVLCPS